MMLNETIPSLATFPIPENLPLLMGDLTPDQAGVVDRIFKGQTDLKTNLLDLSKFWKVKVWFDREIDIRIQPHRQTTKKDSNGIYTVLYKQHVHTNTHIFHQIYHTTDGTLVYTTSKASRIQWYYFPRLDWVVKYEPVIEKDRDQEFKSYGQFKAKFNPFFITEAEIQKLWNETSNQHGGRYKPSDFHSIGPRGKGVLKDFLRNFKGISSTDPNAFLAYHPYSETSKELYLDAYYKTSYHSGRDIKIEHRAGLGFVWYASEYQGCGNGRYGIVANKNQFLWVEDD
jgi:hypothetical protein